MSCSDLKVGELARKNELGADVQRIWHARKVWRIQVLWHVRRVSQIQRVSDVQSAYLDRKVSRDQRDVGAQMVSQVIALCLD